MLLFPCEKNSFPAAPSLTEPYARQPDQRTLRTNGERVLAAAGVTLATLASIVKIDSAITPIWEAGLGRPEARIERIVGETLPSDTLITIATTPGFNANYYDMAQAKKGVAEEYNARLVFARNGNKDVQPETIASLIYQDMPKQKNDRFGEYMQSSVLVLDGHSMGGKVALWVAAWFVQNYPEIQITVVLDSSPNDITDVQGFAAQSVVRGLSAAAPKKDFSAPTPSIGPGVRFLAESINRLSEEPMRAITDKHLLFDTLSDKFRNLGANNQPLGNSALSEQANIINTPFSPELVQIIQAAGVDIIRLSPELDTTVYNDSSVAGYSRLFGKDFCNLPVPGATHGSPNEPKSHEAYMYRWRQILGDIIGLQPRDTLLEKYTGRIFIPAQKSSTLDRSPRKPLSEICNTLQ